ncbi:radical SAM (seleno)protein TrsS [uncultured Desulfovibrio sp.]|uniref:radical SAM (seleno)protein TrsS n=1 Tax=uncultured Desulfovibrio sp. TaxID=167968 RepID=UPI0025EA222A|nr:radical SAM (seleno)protein TrsS [uncultured Desulfovibrio sp.]
MSETARTLHRTQSVCPVCLRRIDAAYVREGEAVVFRKSCPQHGSFAVPVLRQTGGLPAFEDWQRPKTPSYPAHPLTAAAQGCPFDCGLCPGHAQHTCSALLEVTLRCDMACPVCYAAAGGKDVPPDPDMATLIRQLDRLRQVSPGCNVQLSGGEPTLRDDLPDIIQAVRARGFGLVQVNSNGLRLGREPSWAARLREAGLDSVYLQWDAPDDAACAPLRGSLPQGESLMARKSAAVRHCAAAGLGVVLVATLLPEANLPRLGDLLRQALRLGPAVRGLHLQPLSRFGRYPGDLLTAPRLPLFGVLEALCAQAPELVRPEHVHPPGCEHSLCSFSAVYARETAPDGTPALRLLADAAPACCGPSSPARPAAATLTAPLEAAEGARRSRQFVAAHWAGAEPASASVVAADDFSRFLARAGMERRFTLSCMAFQDALDFDVERVRGCCIHIMRPDGRLVPFCVQNLTAVDGSMLYPDRLHPGSPEDGGGHGG